MAPALTQATPHQRCCPAGNGPSSPAGPLALLHHPAVSPRARRKPVWPDDGPKRTRKCSGARASSVTLNSERSTNSYEARPRHSDTELSECNEELDGAETLDPAPLANGSPAAEGDGDGDGAMGLEPTASGDRMEMDAPPLAAESPRKASELAEVGIDVDPATVDAILDVMTGIDVEHMELALPEMDEAPGAESGPPEPAGRLPPVDKEAEVERRLAEVRSRQLAIETRCQTLLKRAGRVQSRHVGRHVADQVAHFVAYAKETLAIGAKGRPGHHGANGANLYGWAEDGRLPTREEVRNIPTATLVNLVSRLQAPPVSYLSNRRYFGLPAKSGGQQGTHHHHHHQQRPGAQLSSQVAESIEEVAGLWEAQLRYLQRHDDPDATESSSGGESDDETIDPAPAPVETTDPASSSVHPLPAVKPVSTYVTFFSRVKLFPTISTVPPETVDSGLAPVLALSQEPSPAGANARVARVGVTRGRKRGKWVDRCVRSGAGEPRVARVIFASIHSVAAKRAARTSDDGKSAVCREALCNVLVAVTSRVAKVRSPPFDLRQINKGRAGEALCRSTVGSRTLGNSGIS